MANFAVVTEALDLLLSTKPGSTLPDNAVEGYYWALEPIPDEVIIEAAAVAARTSGAFIPDAGTIYEAALDIMDTELPTDEAWELVLKHSKSASLGANNPVKLPERTARALDLIGGDVGWSMDELQYRRREFIEVYQRQSKQWRNDVSLGNLPAGNRRLLTNGD